MARLAFLFALAALSCTAQVGDGLDEAQAERMLRALWGADIAASKAADPKAQGAYAVIVPSADIAEAVRVLVGVRLPERPQPDHHLLPSLAEQRALRLQRVARELEQSLEGVPGIARARVHLAAEEPAPLSPTGNAHRARASVLLEHTTEPLPLSVDAVRQLVAGGVVELDPASVEIVSHRVVGAKPAPPALVRFGPVMVSERTAAAAKWIVFLALLLFSVTAFVLLWLWFVLRKLKRQRLAE